LSNLSTLTDYVKEITDTQNKLLENTNIPSYAKTELLNEDYQYLLKDIHKLTQETQDGLLSVKDIVSELCGYVRNRDKGYIPLDINNNIHSTLNMIRNEIKYQYQVTCNLNSLPDIYGNSGKLNQVLLNILMNSIQAIPSGGIIHISSFSKNGKVIIEISDNGPGISSEHLMEIFSPFYTTKAAGEGTGLGLFICYKIITEEHLGSIDVESTGKGSLFRITLPEYEQAETKLKSG